MQATPQPQDMAQVASIMLEWATFTKGYAKPLQKTVTFGIEYIGDRDEAKDDPLMHSLLQLPIALTLQFQSPFKSTNERSYKRRHEYPQLPHRHVQPKTRVQDIFYHAQ